MDEAALGKKTVCFAIIYNNVGFFQFTVNVGVFCNHGAPS